jgi:hypothetical protein
LSGKELEELKVFWLNYGVRDEGIIVKPSFKLILSKLLAWNEGEFYEFTSLGKIPVGALPLRLFNEVQEQKLLEKLSKLEQAAQRAQLINSRLTEYFQFTDTEAVWDDLRQMQPKVLEPVELELLEGNANKAMSVTI